MSLLQAGWTALLAASEHGHNQIACLLLKFPGIDVNICDADGRSALMWAVSTGNEGLVDAILQSPTTDIHLRDKVFHSLLCEHLVMMLRATAVVRIEFIPFPSGSTV